MKTITSILAIDSSSCIRIENEPYLRLVIERIGTGPNNLPAISVAHYGEQNGDPMRDPEMCFELAGDGRLYPYYFRNDYIGLEQQVYFTREDGAKMIRPRLKRELEAFARTWNRNIREQGFVQEAKLAAKQKNAARTSLSLVQSLAR